MLCSDPWSWNPVPANMALARAGGVWWAAAGAARRLGSHHRLSLEGCGFLGDMFVVCRRPTRLGIRILIRK